MSIPYSLAIALLFDETGCYGYTENMINDNSVSELMEKISIKENTQYTKMCPERRISEIMIKLIDGTTYSKRVDYPLGEPENEMSDEQIENKCKNLMKYAGISDEKSNELIQLAKSIDVRGIMDVLSNAI